MSKNLIVNDFLTPRGINKMLEAHLSEPPPILLEIFIYLCILFIYLMNFILLTQMVRKS